MKGKKCIEMIFIQNVNSYFFLLKFGISNLIKIGMKIKISLNNL